MLFQGFQNILDGAAAAVAAAGSAQGDAAAITAKVNVISAADGTKGVVLPAGDGDCPAVFVLYSSVVTNACKVYPPTGGSINAASANAAFSMTAQKPTLFVRVSSLQWLALLSA
jgi:hypothetical protein